MNQKKYLPIGSVVLLKGAKKRLMITGFCAQPDNDMNKIYDYSGCLYPQGIISTDAMAVFNHEDIETVYNVGYIDNEEIEFKKGLDKVAASK